MIKETLKIFEYLENIREFRNFLTLGLIDEGEQVKLAKILSMIPETSGGERLLEVMGYPWFLSASIRRFTSYDLTVTVHREKDKLFPVETSDTLSLSTGETLFFEPVSFALERERFPFPTGFFNGVLLVDVMQHLKENLPLLFSELNRVTREGGFLLIVTPNALRFENLLKLFRGENIYEPYSGMGMWGRAFREYAPAELEELISSHNFIIKNLMVEDIKPRSHIQWKTMKSFKDLVSLLYPEARDVKSEEYMFLLCEKKGSPRYSFPGTLFQFGEKIGPEFPEGGRGGKRPAITGNKNFILDFIEVGLNDDIQLGEGWYEKEIDGKPFRWSRECGELFLRNDCSKGILKLKVMVAGNEEKIEPPVLMCGEDSCCKADFLKQEVVEGWWHELYYRIPPSASVIRRIIMKVENPVIPQEAIPGSIDKRLLGVALSFTGLLYDKRLIMGHNDDLLLGEGWEPLECSPPYFRRMKKNAGLTLYPAGDEESIRIQYSVPEEFAIPDALTVSLGETSFEIPLQEKGRWHIFSAKLPGRFRGPIEIMLSISSLESPGKECDDEIRIAVSRIELE